ncbi:hypothetical protein LguiB_017627 [Lonicera macranthoides]
MPERETKIETTEETDDQRRRLREKGTTEEGEIALNIPTDESSLTFGDMFVKEIIKGIKNGVHPIPVHSGLGGAYYFRNCIGETVAIVKPIDEEPFAPNNSKGFVGKALKQAGLKCQ